MTVTAALSQVEKLTSRHVLRNFRCGVHDLDHFLMSYALKNQRAESSATYVVHRGDVVAGYFTLAFGSVDLAEIPSHLAVGMPPSFRVPVMILAHWAVNEKEQGNGLGRALLKEAFWRTVQAAEIAGLRAMILDAINDRIAAYYITLGFQPCPVGERRMMISMQDVRASLAP